MAKDAEPESFAGGDWIAKARQFSRPKLVEAGWSDDEIDRLVKQAQREVEPGPG